MKQKCVSSQKCHLNKKKTIEFGRSRLARQRITRKMRLLRTVSRENSVAIIVIVLCI